MKKTAVLVAAACVAMTGVTACGGSDSGGGSSQGSAPDANTDNSKNDMNPQDRTALKQGGTLTWALSQTIPNFNYYNVNGTLQDTVQVLNAVEPRPFHFDAAGAPSVNTDYFTSIKKTSDSPQTIEYVINPKATWSNGRKLSYQDFAAIWQANNGTNDAFQVSGSQGYDQIASVKRGSNDQDVIVTYAKPYTDWQSLFDPFMPMETQATPAAFNKGSVSQPPVTSGPFKWGGSNKTQKTYTVVADSNWWGAKPKLDSIVFAAYNDPSSAVQALGQGELDYADISLGDAVNNVAAVNGYSGDDVRVAAGNNYRQITLNTRDPLLADVKVRQAVILGINRKAMTTALIGKLGGNPTPLQNHFFMKNQSAYTETCGDYCDYSPTKAKSLLESDGWTMSGGYYTKDGKQLALSITIPAETPNSKIEAEIAQASLKEAGIKLTLQTVPSDDFFPKYIFSDPASSSGKFQLTTFTWIGTAFPVGGALSIFKYNPKAKGQNAGFGGTQAINTLLTNAATASSTAQEDTLANTASKEMWSNAAWLPLYQRPQVTGVKKTVANLGSYGFADIRYEDIGFTK